MASVATASREVMQIVRSMEGSREGEGTARSLP
jgi:hypothetical protein